MASETKNTEVPIEVRKLSTQQDREEVREAIEVEHTLTFLDAFRYYPKAIGWSMYFSVGVIMLSFDPQLLGNLYAMPAFQKDFGYPFEDGYLISAAWQTGLGMGNPIGQVVGALAAGYPMEWYGRKKTFNACVVAVAGLVFIQFFARSLKVLLAGELLAGLVLGAFVVIAPSYASEVTPLAMRSTATSYVNLCFVTGQLLGNGVTAATKNLDSHWAYSIPFSIQWFWVLIIIPGMAFAPESPWWLARQGRVDEAEQSLRRLSSKNVNVHAVLAQLIETDRLEAEMEAGSTYMDVFRKVNWRRTEVAIGVYATQVLCGIYLINYGTYFFSLAGLNTDQAYDMGMGFLAVGWVSTVFSWFLMQRYGRRPLYNLGLLIMTIIMFIVGILDCVPGKGPLWGKSALLLVWNFTFDWSVGPVAYAVFCEVSATRVRSKTIAVATAVQAVVGIIMTVAIPYLIAPDKADLGGKLGFFFGGLSIPCLVWCYFRLPEMKGRTYEELDIMFERNVPTREFGKYKI
ncbi:MFS sugar transporter-like protein [Lophiostoma macrostomum CBS 122681]|uniref:MFS sugar transporter-like protein n=1 Tax=Lophiostoma macrostomum CBS 122681 TaxID=1314788 RepID=A0A6A6TRU0_9PLEO|nr:MFS sugar transporter-like protein [Lophiostoma macrostomum CBS 122681]